VRDQLVTHCRLPAGTNRVATASSLHAHTNAYPHGHTQRHTATHTQRRASVVSLTIRSRVRRSAFGGCCCWARSDVWRAISWIRTIGCHFFGGRGGSNHKFVARECGHLAPGTWHLAPAKDTLTTGVSYGRPLRESAKPKGGTATLVGI
jgi:hypothetical protein